MSGPRNLEEAKKYRYNRWAGNPNGWSYRPNDCAAKIYDSAFMMSFQCSRKNGHGPDGIFCKQHAKREEQSK